jgi:kynurenine formamidase
MTELMEELAYDVGRLSGRLIDLSMPIQGHPGDPTFGGIDRTEHAAGGDLVWKEVLSPKTAGLRKRLLRFGRYLRARRYPNHTSFPDGMFLSNETYTLSVHCGTHLDAPYHFGPLCEGRPARRIHDVPLDWCFGPGVVLDLTQKGPGEVITAADIDDALAQTGYELRAGDIVLVRTDSDLLWPKREYFTDHPGMSEAATRFLIERGVKLIGIDACGFDLPFGRMIQDYLATRNRDVLWPAHMYGRHHEYVHMERLANLRLLPRSHGFLLACFPIAAQDAGASWVRAVAIV